MEIGYILQPMTAIRTYLDNVDPRLWPLAIALVAGGVVWGWRKLSPKSFDRLPPAIQALPAILIAAAIGGATGSDLVHMMFEAASGAVSGLLAVGGHHTLKALKK